MSTSELKRSAFYEVQDQLGAEWTDWEGWAWADHFGDAVAEHEATRKASNLWDESPLRKWDMKGPDALALADVLFTNDVSVAGGGDRGRDGGDAANSAAVVPQVRRAGVAQASVSVLRPGEGSLACM